MLYFKAVKTQTRGFVPIIIVTLFIWHRETWQCLYDQWNNSFEEMLDYDIYYLNEETLLIS